MDVHVKLVDAATGSFVVEKSITKYTSPTAGAFSVGATDGVLPLIVGNLIAGDVVSAAKK